MFLPPKYIEFSELEANILSYNPKSDIQKVRFAFEYAKNHHGDQMRKSGHPYYTHPLAVANILALLHLDDASIISGLLHDIVEDTDITLEDIVDKFGAEVAKIVDGVTKLGSIKYKTEEIQQTENLRKLFLALSQDLRVLIIKLCDRLHNMLTIDGVSNQNKKRIKAIETLEIYAPLAERIGVYQLKDSLQDLAFEVINPRARNSIIKRIDDLISGIPDGAIVAKAEYIKTSLESFGFDLDVSYRIKTPYSIWNKIQNKKRNFESIHDIIGYRIITKTTEECYQVLSAVHTLYKFVPNTFKDYISTPKQNGYKSLHTSVIDEHGIRCEFQIRSEQMNRNAEFGLASHWGYKDCDSRLASEDVKIKWISQILEILNSPSPATEVLEYTKLEMYKSKIFVFTVDGDVVHMPSGSTVLDFAFAINVELAKKAYGAKVNGVVTNDLGTKILNGDKIEIIPAKNDTISQDWSKYVNSGLAKHYINKITKEFISEADLSKGIEIIKRSCELYGITFSQDIISILMREYGLQTASDLYMKCFKGVVDPMKIFEKIFGNRVSKAAPIISANSGFILNSNAKVMIREIPNLRCILPQCCRIVDGGDNWLNFIDGIGVFLHSQDCMLLKMIQKNTDKWLLLKTTLVKKTAINARITSAENILSKIFDFEKKFHIKLQRASTIYDGSGEKYEFLVLGEANVVYEMIANLGLDLAVEFLPEYAKV